MLKKSMRLPHVIFLLSLSLVMGGMTFLFWYYQNSGLSNGEQIASIYEASAKIDEIKNKNELDLIKRKVEEDQSRDAVRMLDQTLRAFYSFKAVKSTKESIEDLEQKSLKVKNALNEIIALPEAKSLISVLSEKISKFVDFTNENNWKTLGRISERLNVRLVKTTAPLTIKKINEVIRETKQDTSIMRSVTESSVLPREDKSIIFTRLNSLDTELKMLEQYLAEVEEFGISLDQFNAYLKTWISKSGPELSLARLQIDKKARYFIFYQIGVMVLCFLTMIFGGIALIKHNRRAQKKLEADIVSLINDGLLNRSAGLNPVGSPHFVNQLKNAKSYLQKRMGFSSIFQEALPFASILLDSNLKVIWANPQFCETWKIGPKDIDTESFSWDYIVRYTNLAGNDPVIEALKAGLAGIYQVQVKVDHNSPRISYEMYVNPVEGPADAPELKKIMIFFYPLTHLEETISGHAKSLLGPIRKSIEALSQNLFNAQFRSQIQKDFEAADILDVYEKFCHFDDYSKAQFHGLMKEIERLENIVADNHQLFGELKNINIEQIHEAQLFAHGIENFKGQMLSLTNYGTDLSGLNNETSDMVGRAVKQLKLALSFAKSCLEGIAKASENLSSIEEGKNHLRTGREELKEARDKILLTLDQAMVFHKSADLDPLRMEQVFGKIKSDIKYLDKVILQFDKLTQGLELKISKMVMMLNTDADRPSIEEVSNAGKEVSVYDYELHEKISFNKDLAQSIKVSEEKIIRAFKELYESCKKNLERGSRIEKILSKEIEEYQGQNLQIGVALAENKAKNLAEIESSRTMDKI